MVCLEVILYPIDIRKKTSNFTLGFYLVRFIDVFFNSNVESKYKNKMWKPTTVGKYKAKMKDCHYYYSEPVDSWVNEI